MQSVLNAENQTFPFEVICALMMALQIIRSQSCAVWEETVSRNSCVYL